TPVGDRVEIESLHRVWEGRRRPGGRCVLGSVKSNVGHLLPGAGAAGVMKVLLALRHRTFPPTAHFERPAAGLDPERGPFEVLAEPRPWEERDPGTPRRAAVSAFGLGGINAHLLLEEWRAPAAAWIAPAAPKPAAVPVAVVGLAARFGPWDDAAALEARVLGDAEERPRARPRDFGLLSCGAAGTALDGVPGEGYFLERLVLPLDRFRVPPRELEETLPQQLLMLAVAADAVRDADVGDHLGERSGVFVGLGLDPNTNNFHLRWALEQEARTRQPDGKPAAELLAALRDAASPPLTANRTMGALAPIVASRIARHFGITGPSFALAAEEASGLRAVELGVRALGRGELDLAVAGAVDLAGDLRTVVGGGFGAAGDCRPLQAGSAAALAGEGAGAVVLKRLADARRDGNRIYAVITGLGVAGGARAIARALAEAGARPDRIGYVEAHGSGRADEDRIEAEALAAGYGGPQGNRGPALGSAKSAIGHAGAAAGMAGLLRACFCLNHRLLPPLAPAEKLRPELREAGLESAPHPRPWLRNRIDGPRRAAVNAIGSDGTWVHVVLEEAADPALPAVRARSPLACSEALFTLQADSPAELDAALDALARLAAGSAAQPVHHLAQRWRETGTPERPGARGVALVARDAAELRGLIARARAAIAADPDGPLPGGTESNRSASDRIFYAPAPLAGPDALAFLYPGAGNHYPGMGEGLGAHFPDVLARQDRANERLLAQFAPAREAAARGTAHLGRKRNEALLAQVAHGALVTDVLAAAGVRPRAAVGYSLGESAALFALGAWRGRDEMLRRLESSPLFTRDLGGECRAARAVWGLRLDEPVDWLSGVLDRGAGAVREALAGRERVYLQVIHTPEECVVGGYRPEVEALVRELGCRFVPQEGVSTVHCPVLAPVAEAYETLHRLEATPPEGVRFYSGAWCRSYAVTRESAAAAIRAQAERTLDFPALIERAWADGARIFVEVGPGASTSRMVRRILAGRPHLTRALAPAGGDEMGGLVRLLAALAAAGVRIDAGAVLGPPAPPLPAPASGRVLEVDLGGRPFARPAPPPPSTLARAPAAPSAARPSPAPAPVATPPPSAGVSPAPGDDLTALLHACGAADLAIARAHEAYLSFARESDRLLATAHEAEQILWRLHGGAVPARVGAAREPVPAAPAAGRADPAPAALTTGVAFTREQCLEFATGAVARVLGPRFAEVDAFPSRVRLPAEPLMLVDRIVAIEGEVGSLGRGRIVTEHDVRADGWYLDGGAMPVGLAIEAGQADLFLSAYLGIDAATRGLAVYRLLDAAVTFHRALPRPGEVIRYDIEIERFFRQGRTHLFRFRFDGTVNGEPLLSMRAGAAGFFTAGELAAGQGIVAAELERFAPPATSGIGPQPLAPAAPASLDRARLEALRRGELGAAFGPAFGPLAAPAPLTIPAGPLALLDRVVELRHDGGRFGRGFIRAEQDIHPDAWYLTCHFADDPVMPGTLMYECSLQALRVFVLSLGWVAERGAAAWEPVPGVTARLRCRGQVVPATRVAAYEVHVKELGAGPEPYALADTVMFADGRPIVHITDMNLRLAGTDCARLAARWAASTPAATPAHIEPAQPEGAAAASGALPAPAEPPLFDHDRILEFATGRPSAAFGEPYRPFDEGRFLARLPAPPFNFLQRIRRVERAAAWRLAPGAVAVAEYDVPPDAWYFAADRQPRMPYAIVLETALQACGWLAAYLGSALVSDRDLRFRNLGGEAVQHRAVAPEAGRLTTTVHLERVSRSGGLILQHYGFSVTGGGQPIFTGATDFGFFPAEALAAQAGLRDAAPYRPPAPGRSFAYPDAPPFPERRLRMVDRIDCLLADGGPAGLGFVRGSARVDPEAWYFHAHFLGDPVWPGSLGLEAFLQLLKAAAAERWKVRSDSVFESAALGVAHRWVYRGQVVPGDAEVTVEAAVTHVDEESRLMLASGSLMIDGRAIYRIDDLGLRLAAGS
ncbi:MAG: type I polyketide synthase, partial [Planctomycetes bacterium]|nr:type I polyketide synthase [Planctomycetota bacterium]